jgi:hypothetical protein
MLTRIVHVKAHLLNSVDDVRAHEGEVWRAPARLLYSAGLATGGPVEAASFGDTFIGVVADLQAVRPALSRISATYLAYKGCMLEESRVTAMPRK